MAGQGTVRSQVLFGALAWAVGLGLPGPLDEHFNGFLAIHTAEQAGSAGALCERVAAVRTPDGLV